MTTNSVVLKTVRIWMYMNTDIGHRIRISYITEIDKLKSIYVKPVYGAFWHPWKEPEMNLAHEFAKRIFTTLSTGPLAPTALTWFTYLFGFLLRLIDENYGILRYIVALPAMRSNKFHQKISCFMDRTVINCSCYEWSVWQVERLGFNGYYMRSIIRCQVL